MKPAPALLLLAVLAHIGTGATSPQYRTPSSCAYAGKARKSKITLVACEGLKPAGHLLRIKPSGRFPLHSLYSLRCLYSPNAPRPNLPWCVRGRMHALFLALIHHADEHTRAPTRTHTRARAQAHIHKSNAATSSTTPSPTPLPIGTSLASPRLASPRLASPRLASPYMFLVCVCARAHAHNRPL